MSDQKFIGDFKNDPKLSALLAKQAALKAKIRRVKPYDELKAYLTELEEDLETTTAQINFNKKQEEAEDKPLIKPVSSLENGEEKGEESLTKPVLENAEEEEESLTKPALANGEEEEESLTKTVSLANAEEKVEEEAVEEENKAEKAQNAFKNLVEQQGKVINNIKNKPKMNQLTGKRIDTEEITLSGQVYFIRYDKKSRTRRKEIFLNNNDKLSLTPEEKELLDNIGITEDTYEAVRKYLYDFFEALPNCQSSIEVLTNRECEVSYYVLWSVLLKARQDVQRKIDEQTRDGLIDSKLLQYEARLKSLSTRSTVQTDARKPCDESHDEHVEITDLVKRVEGKINNVKQRLNAQKGGTVGGGLNEIQRLYRLFTQ